MSTKGKPESYTVINLDDEVTWIAKALGVAIVLVLVGVLVAPWLVDLRAESEPASVPLNHATTSSVCRPANEVPAALIPLASSWERTCDWFIAPPIPPVVTPDD